MNIKMLAKKATYHAKKHKYKIILGTPIIFALFVNVNNVGPTINSLSLLSSNSSFVEVGDRIHVTLTASTQKEINAVGGRVIIGETFAIRNIESKSSIIDLWAQDPSIVNNEISFSGGITDTEHFIGQGDVFSFDIEALEPGTHTLTLLQPELLANDGVGTNILTEKHDKVFHVREKGASSPDVNGDGHISLMDINIVYFNSLRAYNTKYDINKDGDVNLDDVKILLSLM